MLTMEPLCCNRLVGFVLILKGQVVSLRIQIPRSWVRFLALFKSKVRTHVNKCIYDQIIYNRSLIREQKGYQTSPHYSTMQTQYHS